MEGILEGPIEQAIPSLFGEECLDVESSSSVKARESFGTMGYAHFVNKESLSLEEEEEKKTPSFLEMLKSVEMGMEMEMETETPSLSFIRQDSFQQLLLSLHHHHHHHHQHHQMMKRPWGVQNHNNPPPPPPPPPHEMDPINTSSAHQRSVEPQSCQLTHDDQIEMKEEREGGEGKRRRRVVGDKKKKKKKNKEEEEEEVESQRMTHIAVERNRRRLMNHHLNTLRSLMPPSYVQRGDQASIIGGAIDYVKELEQLLESLEAHKRMRKLRSSGGGDTSSSSSVAAGVLCNEGGSGRLLMMMGEEKEEEISEDGDGIIKVLEMKVREKHVNMKIVCEKRAQQHGQQLVKAIVALEQLRLTVLHLNITTTLETHSSSSSSSSSVVYSFNLKVSSPRKHGYF